MPENSLMIETFENDSLNTLFVENLTHELPPQWLAIIALKFSGAFSTEEMSQILGISTGTIWSNYKSAIKQLKRLAQL